MKDDDSKLIKSILREKQALGSIALSQGRAQIAIIALVLLYLGVGPGWQKSWLLQGLLLLVVIFNLSGIKFFKKKKGLMPLSIIGITIDAMVVAAVPFAYYAALNTGDLSITFINKTAIVLVCSVLSMSLVCLTMRPIYPILSTLLMIAVSTWLYFHSAFSDAVFSDNWGDVVMGSSLNIQLLVSRIVHLVIIGSILAHVAFIGGRNFSRAILLEQQNKRQYKQLMQADKMASLGALVSGVAHEVNNPNNFIRLNSDNLKDIWSEIRHILDKKLESEGDFEISHIPYSEIREEIGLMIGGISDGTKRIEKIVLDLKNYAKKNSASMDEQVDINLVMGASVNILANLIKNSTNHFSITPGESLPTIKGNSQQVEQVVINLISNACQALQSREKAIRVSSFYEKEHGNVVIEVKDQGPGIPSGDLEKIMEPFFTTKGGEGGTGLGLSISRKIVQQHGGKIEVDSHEGQGTKIKVSLPAQPRDSITSN